MQKRLTILLILILSFVIQAGAQIKFIKNQGQFHSNVVSKLVLNAGDVYFEEGRIKYCLYDKNKITDIHHHQTNSKKVKGHNYNVVFQNPQIPSFSFNKKLKPYYNYYIGNDTSKWASHVPLFEELKYLDIYNGIDLKYYSSYGQLKYDFILGPGAKVGDIGWKYEGIDYSVQRGHIIIQTSLGKIVEQSPYAYQLIDGKETKVDCKYVIKEGVVGFECGEYDPGQPLVIDPVLVFATYTGSTADNWGYTATYDNNENMYVGGVAFAMGYPTTLGAFEVNYSGGTGINYPGDDVSISKFSSDGTSLLYSTYLGGSGQENPHSLVCNSNDELYVLGSTSSSNFPTTTNAYNSSYNGGVPVNYEVFSFADGTDGYVTKFNANGTALLGSTFFGGSDNDVVNLGGSLRFNYGDVFRGEIIVDNNDNCWVATCTKSTDFPTVNGVQSTNAGGTDAIVMRFNSDLSSMLWSTYYGGTADDAAFSLQFDSQNNIIFTGGTQSFDLPMAGSPYHPNNSGLVEGYIAKINASGNNLLASTYLGSSVNDQCYFVQTDLTDNIYVFGQTRASNYPITAGTYNNPGSGQFIHCFTPDLSTTEFSTVFGAGNGINISPSAFSVTDCKLIYVSGWGGAVNSSAVGGSTVGMPLTSDAFQSTTDGSDFYVAVFAPNASNLLFGTFFGGGTSYEHVDGGTSRFDKKGNVYQAVCAGCGGHSDFPTTAGVWSNTNNSSNCNLGAFKFALEKIHPVISLAQPWVCMPNSYSFGNNSQGGNLYQWDFGDGDTSDVYQPTHVYNDTGHYEVTLIVSDSLGCFSPDTATVYLDVFALNNAIIQGPTDTICSSDSVQLFATGGAIYDWSPGDLVSDSTIANPWAFPDTTTTFTVMAHDSCGDDYAQVVIYVYNEQVSTIPDTTICYGAIVTLEAYGGTAYSWYPNTAMINPGTPTPNVAPTSDITYYVDVTTPLNCILTDSVMVNVITDMPIPQLTSDTTICRGDSLVIAASGGEYYNWTSNSNYSMINDSVIMAHPTDTSIYNVEYVNSCGNVFDSVVVNVVDPTSYDSPDMIICPGDTVNVWAGGGVAYQWLSNNNSIAVNDSTLEVFPSLTTDYIVQVTNGYGCVENEVINITVYPIPYVSAGPDFDISFGQSVTLMGQTDVANFIWSPNDSIDCLNCLQPLVYPSESMYYVLTVTDTNGCVNRDTTYVTLDGAIYVPNTFTPNGDGINDLFVVKGKDIKTFEFWIFDRWGELIFHTNNMNTYWDGTFGGKPVQIDAYIWKMEYEDYQNHYGNLIGHVNVIR